MANSTYRADFIYRNVHKLGEVRLAYHCRQHVAVFEVEIIVGPVQVCRHYRHIVGAGTHSELDLLDTVAVRRFFDEEQPDAVVLAAAHAG